MNKSDYEVRCIPPDTTKPWILNRHYAKRLPPISYAFGLFRFSALVGIVTYGMPASPHLCKGICGKQWKNYVLELNRLVLLSNLKNEASYLVGNSLKMLAAPKVIVSYADTEQNHIGYVYQATNWLYTGATKERTDMLSESGHSRHDKGNPGERQFRSAKHRYIFFVGNKRQKRILREALNYDILEYPKGDSKHYETSPDDIPGQQMILF